MGWSKWIFSIKNQNLKKNFFRGGGGEGVGGGEGEGIDGWIDEQAQINLPQTSSKMRA